MTSTPDLPEADRPEADRPDESTPASDSRVSIALATFNGERYLEEQLESFARQERLPDELVVCDDHSTDDTLAILRGFAHRAPFDVRIEVNDSQLQTTANFERAVSLCTGDLVLLSDQDDVWDPAKIRILAGVLDRQPEVGAVFCNGRVADAKLRPSGDDLWGAQLFSVAEQRRVRAGRGFEVLVRHSVASGNTLAFRSAHRELYLPLPALRDCHDLWIALIVSAVSGLAIVDDELLSYRVHDRNVFGMREYSLREQLAQARKQIEVGAFDHSVALYRAVRERLRGAPLLDSAGTLDVLDAKIEHFQCRRAMSGEFLRRLAPVAEELLTGRYSRFAYGWKSAAQDLFLR